MSDPLIGPGDNDYGRSIPQPDDFGMSKINPCEGSPATTAQMEAVIALRNASALDSLVKHIQGNIQRGNFLKCACGYDTLGIDVHEVVSVHICPNCFKVLCSGPDGVTDLMQQDVPPIPYLKDKIREHAQIAADAVWDIDDVKAKLTTAREALKAAEGVAIRNFKGSLIHQMISKALKESA